MKAHSFTRIEAVLLWASDAIIVPEARKKRVWIMTESVARLRHSGTRYQEIRRAR